MFFLCIRLTQPQFCQSLTPTPLFIDKPTPFLVSCNQLFFHVKVRNRQCTCPSSLPFIYSLYRASSSNPGLFTRPSPAKYQGSFSICSGPLAESITRPTSSHNGLKFPSSLFTCPQSMPSLTIVIK